MSRIRASYRGGGLPLRWQDEQSGQLPDAVLAYFQHTATANQLALVCDYCRYYIMAPCWDMGTAEYEEGQQLLAKLREKAASMREYSDINEFINEFIKACFQMGMDPL